MLADVDAGSDTPSLVGKVLKWRKENPEDGEFLSSSVLSLRSLFSVSAFLSILLRGNLILTNKLIAIFPAKKLWDITDSLNQKFGKTLLELTDLSLKYPKEYPKIIKYLSSLQPRQVCQLDPFPLVASSNGSVIPFSPFSFLQWLANPFLPESEQQIIEGFHTARQTAEVRAKVSDNPLPTN